MAQSARVKSHVDFRDHFGRPVVDADRPEIKDLLGCSARSSYRSCRLKSTGRPLAHDSTAARPDNLTRGLCRVDGWILGLQWRCAKLNSILLQLSSRTRSVYCAWLSVSNCVRHHDVKTSTGRTRYAHDLTVVGLPSPTRITEVGVCFEYLLAEVVCGRPHVE